MSCHQIEPHIVDLARGVSDHDAQLARHILGCPSCAGRLEQERAMSAALGRLADELMEPPVDPQRELALLAMFDQRGARRPSRVRPTVWTGLLAAGVAFAAVFAWHASSAPGVTPPIAIVARGTSQAQAVDSGSVVVAAEPQISAPVDSHRRIQSARARAQEASDSAEFMAWPGATAWPPFESGELIRVDIPTDAGVVQADVLVGQDGFARAIRLVQ